MQWLMAIETNDDPITGCRLMNFFRRKNVQIVTLAMTARAAGYSIMALVETPESEVEHLFNFLRRAEGVRHVAYYRHQPAGDASFVFIDSEAGSSSFDRFLKSFPESRLVFASDGKYLLEVPAEKLPRSAALGLGQPEFLPFACVRTTRSAAAPELAVARAS